MHYRIGISNFQPKKLKPQLGLISLNPLTTLVGPKLCEHLEVLLKRSIRPHSALLRQLQTRIILSGRFKQKGIPACACGWLLLIDDPDR